MWPVVSAALFLAAARVPPAPDLVVSCDWRISWHDTKVQSESEFLAERGLSSPISGFADDKMRSNRQIRTSRGAKAFQKAAQRASSDYHTQRESARAEYRSRVQSGAVRPPSSVEKALKTAQGNSDNEAVRAARRILAKRGIDWKTGKRLARGKVASRSSGS